MSPSRTSAWRLREAVAVAVAIASWTGSALALDWIHLTPNPAYSRDLAMGASTVALPYLPSSQSVNPAGLWLYDAKVGLRHALFVNLGGLWQAARYWKDEAPSRSAGERAGDAFRMLAGSIAVQSRAATLAVLLSQPVMLAQDAARYEGYEHRSPLSGHQNSVLLSFALHPRVAVGGRVDRYYAWDVPQGEGYSYGVILRPRGVRLGVQYQRFPASGARLWHPLDRRGDQCTTAGVALGENNLALSFQVMNLIQSDGPAFLEPHAGVEWRPLRAVSLRAGGMQFSRSTQWAWTAGVGLLDANWIRSRAARLLVPDDVLQLAVGVIYRRGTPVLGITSLTCSWRL